MIAHPPSTHRFGCRVYYEDTDAGGVVYHANYLRFAERARTEALRDAGISHAAMVQRFNLMFMVRRAEIDYVRPAMLDDSLVVETETMDVGGATVLLRQTVRGPAGVCAVARIHLACVRIGHHKPARIPPEWRAGMLAMRPATPPDAATRESGPLVAAQPGHSVAAGMQNDGPAPIGGAGGDDAR